jgi:hypothetical protein
MSQPSRERRELPVLMRWPYAGNDTSRPNRRRQRIVRSLISSKRLPKRLPRAPIPERRSSGRVEIILEKWVIGWYNYS